MRDVAALAGVSIKTVSRVVNGEPGVSPELVRRVDRAALQLDYHHNLTASSLRRADRKSGIVGLLLEDVANPFSSGIHRAIGDAAAQRGVAVLAMSLDEDPVRERDFVRAMLLRRVDGLVIMPSGIDHGYLRKEIRPVSPSSSSTGHLASWTRTLSGPPIAMVHGRLSITSWRTVTAASPSWATCARSPRHVTAVVATRTRWREPA